MPCLCTGKTEVGRSKVLGYLTRQPGSSRCQTQPNNQLNARKVWSTLLGHKLCINTHACRSNLDGFGAEISVIELNFLAPAERDSSHALVLIIHTRRMVCMNASIHCRYARVGVSKTPFPTYPMPMGEIKVITY